MFAVNFVELSDMAQVLFLSARNRSWSSLPTNNAASKCFVLNNLSSDLVVVADARYASRCYSRLLRAKESSTSSFAQ